MDIDFFRGEHGFLSNFSSSPMEYQGMTWRTVEHAFQAAKATDPVERMGIKMAASAAVARHLGKTCKSLRPDWDEVRLQVMEDILRAKFSIPDFRARLLDTGDAHLREGNYWGDRFWGQELVDGDWVGENHLGKLLMKIRSELRAPKA